MPKFTLLFSGYNGMSHIPRDFDDRADAREAVAREEARIEAGQARWSEGG